MKTELTANTDKVLLSSWEATQLHNCWKGKEHLPRKERYDASIERKIEINISRWTAVGKKKTISCTYTVRWAWER